MPYLHVQTNASPTRHEQSAFLSAASEAISRILSKNPNYVMTSIECDRPLNFASSELPAAFLELTVLGLDVSKNKELATTLSDLARVHLHVDEDRCFSRFVDTPRGCWGLGNDVF
ncbi:MAG: phenylpyruvate tautomerase MIF-related protein [Verrucomicrobiota bacterium JB023]|nr:phenylpyruvate tautomerase MIF-related protein [Verrucomicrobiota bacterium JB023]